MKKYYLPVADNTIAVKPLADPCETVEEAEKVCRNYHAKAVTKVISIFLDDFTKKDNQEKTAEYSGSKRDENTVFTSKPIENLKDIKKRYPKGTIVQLEKMDDAQAPPIGTIGIVQGVDDIGSLLMRWSNGSSLNVLNDIDKAKIIEKEEETDVSA